MSEDKPIINIGNVEIFIGLSGDVETAKKQWEKAKEVINTYLEVEEEPETQPKTKTETKHTPWSDEEEEIIANNLDKKPSQLDELLGKEGYERSRGAIYQKRRDIVEQKWDKAYNQTIQDLSKDAKKDEEDEEAHEELEKKEELETVSEDEGEQEKKDDYKKGPWDDWEEEHLINKYHSKKIAEIAENDLNRPYSSVYQKKDKLVSEGKLTPKEKQKKPDDKINEIKQEDEPEDDNKGDDNDEGESESDDDSDSDDSAFPKTLIQYLWRNTSWKRFESRDERLQVIQKLIKDRYGTDISKEEVEKIIDEAES